MSTTTDIRVAPTANPPARSRWSSPCRRFFGVVARPTSYRRISYLLLGLPFGVVWFSVLVGAIATSVSLVVVALIGIPMLWGTWQVVRAFGNVERRAASALLDQQVPIAPMDPGTGTLWKRLLSMSRDRDRWRELGYLLLRLPVGVATFAVAVTALTTPVAVALAPIRARVGDDPFGDWALSARMEDVAVSPWSWLLVPLGVMSLFAAFHLLNRLAEACGRWTARWLEISGEGVPAALSAPQRGR